MRINGSEKVTFKGQSLGFSKVSLKTSKISTPYPKWVIPEKILIPYHGWHLGIQRERGVSWTGILKAWWEGGGGNAVWNTKRMGQGVQL